MGGVRQWTPEQHARYQETVRRKREADFHPIRRPVVDSLERLFAQQDSTRDEIAALRRDVQTLTTTLLESLKSPTVVEWRPSHRRHKDGGAPVRAQRRAVGVPRRPPKAEESAPLPKRRLRVS